MRCGELAQMEHFTEVVLGAQQVTQALAKGPGLECTPVEQAIEQIARAIEGHVLVIPLGERQCRQVLMASLVPLEADLGGFFHAATNRHERSILQLDLKEEDELLKQVEVLEEKELWIALG